MSRHIGVRLPGDLYNIVERAAKEQHRTVSALVVATLRNAYDPRCNGELGVFARLPDMPSAPVGSHLGDVGKELGSVAAAKTVVSDVQLGAFRESPDGKTCKHGFWRCDKGCWK